MRYSLQLIHGYIRLVKVKSGACECHSLIRGTEELMPASILS
jgi:hypothetical protein